MIKTWILTLLRNTKKYKIYTFINIFGLAIGMACCILMFLFINAELNVELAAYLAASAFNTAFILPCS